MLDFLKKIQAGTYLAIAGVVLVAALVVSNIFLLNALNDAKTETTIANQKASSYELTIKAYQDGASRYEELQAKVRKDIKALSKSLSSADIQAQAEQNGTDPADLLNERYAGLNRLFDEATAVNSSASSSASAAKP